MVTKNYSYQHIHRDEYYQNQDVARDVQMIGDELEILFDSAVSKRAGIEEDPGLSHQGKSNEREALKVELIGARQKWLKRLVPLENQKAQIEKEMTLTSHRPDDVVGAIREWEMRSEIRKLDPTEIGIAYRQAAADGDDLFVLAIENAPLPFVFDKRDDVVAEVRQARLERRFPEQSVKLADLNLGLTSLQSALASFESACGLSAWTLLRTRCLIEQGCALRKRSHFV